MKKPRISYDKKADVLYFFIKEGAEEDYEEIAPGVGLELGKNGELLGVEILNASKVLGTKPKIKEKIFEPAWIISQSPLTSSSKVIFGSQP